MPLFPDQFDSRPVLKLRSHPVTKKLFQQIPTITSTKSDEACLGGLSAMIMLDEQD